MRRSVLAIAAVLALSLSACNPAAETPAEPSSPPEASAPAEPTEEATPAPVLVVAIPDTCDELISPTLAKSVLGAAAEPSAVTPSAENPVAFEFAERGGLLCAWVLPNSEAGLSVYVAERDTPSDADTIAQWQNSGLTETPGLTLDAFWHQQLETVVGTMAEARALAGGYELRLEASGADVSALEGVAQEAAANMNYS